MKLNRDWRDIVAGYFVDMSAGLSLAAFGIFVAASGGLAERAGVLVAYLVLAIAFLILAYKIRIGGEKNR